MNVYLKAQKKKLSRLSRRCLWAFSTIWALAALLEFFPAPINLYALLLSLSTIPLGILLLSGLIRSLRRPKLIVANSESFRLRLNPQGNSTDVKAKRDLQLYGNYLCSKGHEQPIAEITRKSAIRLVESFPEMEIDLHPKPVNFPQTTVGRWLAYSAKGLLGVLIFLTLAFGFEVYPYFSNIMMPWNRMAAVEATETWGGLADLPVNRLLMSIETEGSMFTRTFLISFRSSPASIEKWIEASYGIRDVVPTIQGNHYIYRSVGYENSIGGTVTVDYETGRVYIKMSWS